MPEEMKSECVELSMTACEKFANNYEVNQVNSLFCHIRFLGRCYLIYLTYTNDLILSLCILRFFFFFFTGRCLPFGLIRPRRERLKRQWIKSMAFIGMWWLVKVLALKSDTKQRICSTCFLPAMLALLLGSALKIVSPSEQKLKSMSVWDQSHLDGYYFPLSTSISN